MILADGALPSTPSCVGSVPVADPSAASATPAVERIVVVTNDTLWAGALRELCAMVFPQAWIATHRNAQVALESLVAASADLVVTGLDFIGEDGLSLLSRFRQRSRLLLIVSSRKDDWAMMILRTARFDAFFDPQSDDLMVLKEVLSFLAAGNFYLSSSVRERLLSPRLASGLTELTEMELKVLRRIADGSTDAEAAPDLAICEQTLRTHRRNIMNKLSAASSAKLVWKAGLLGIPRPSTS